MALIGDPPLLPGSLARRVPPPVWIQHWLRIRSGPDVMHPVLCPVRRLPNTSILFDRCGHQGRAQAIGTTRSRRAKCRVSAGEAQPRGGRKNPASHSAGFTILQIRDPQADMNRQVVERLLAMLGSIRYDLCLVTGEYRGGTYGPYNKALDGVARPPHERAGTLQISNRTLPLRGRKRLVG
jgi:hypothetical protein